MRFFKTTIMLIFISAISVSISFSQTRTNKSANISNADISLGLKEALKVGVKNAVFDLGRENGYLGNPQVKIPLPKNLQKVEKTLRFAGQGKKVDEFVEAMNRAAEKAVPVAVDIFTDAILQMTFNDARQILFSGQDDAATQFFRRTSQDKLRVKFRPIVEDFTGKVGVTQKYKQMLGKNSLIGAIAGKDAQDLDGYITEKALDGLFLMVAKEERKIRRDPIGRTTSILRKVFGILN